MFTARKKLRETFEFELIDQAEYDAQRQRAVNFIHTDPLYLKLDGKLTLPLDNQSTLVLQDKHPEAEEAEDGIVEYEHIGTINELNAYLVLESVFEGYGYKLINRTNGKTTELSYLPLLLPNQKSLMSLHTIAIEGMSKIELYSIEQGVPPNHQEFF